jgi:hypothetical protein
MLGSIISLEEVVYTRKRRTSLIVSLSLKFVVASALALLSYGIVDFSDAQMIPLPPPAPDMPTNSIDNQNASNDNLPPQIQFQTTELTEGKNVFKVNVTDASEIRLREVSFVSEGEIKTETLVFEGNNIYKALINVKPPSAVIVVNVDDIYGNVASLAKSLPVNKPPDIISRILDMLLNR